MRIITVTNENDTEIIKYVIDDAVTVNEPKVDGTAGKGSISVHGNKVHIPVDTSTVREELYTISVLADRKQLEDQFLLVVKRDPLEIHSEMSPNPKISG